ncbi:MAG: (Fe-S)-binding protein [Sulfuricellaceae bacterium]|jgi:glycolate oxidase iron-sulfur subunit
MSTPAPTSLPDPAQLADLANQCVACGLCLPHCPTYRKTRSEADSPRGRIFMMRGVLEGQLPPSGAFVRHIDLCLACRRCEAVCPSRVEYGRLVEGMRARLAAEQPPFRRRLRRRLLAVAASPGQLRLAESLLRFWQRSGLRTLARALGLLGKLARADAALPDLTFHRAIHDRPGPEEVGLFLGCVARLADSETLRATAFLLEKLGHGVRVPQDQACCGALHRHAGEPEEAEALARRNREAFAGLKTVVVAATGCAPALKEALAPAGIAVREATEYLAAATGWENLHPAPLSGRIAVHEPCSQANVLKDAASPYALLKFLPGAEVVPLPGNDQCCGGAGAYFLLQPEMAGKLLDDKIDAIRAVKPDFVATANIGCALHLGCGVKDAGLDSEIAHPATLVARQLGFGG